MKEKQSYILHTGLLTLAAVGIIAAIVEFSSWLQSSGYLSSPLPARAYEIAITSPAGHVITTTVYTCDQPRMSFVQGTYIAYCDDGPVVAPVGWLMEVRAASDASPKQAEKK